MNSSHHHDNDDRMNVLRTMRALESSVYKRPRAQSMPEMFRGLWRRQIVEWMYVLIKYCKLKHEATAAAVYYLDAAVMCESASLVMTPRDYQLCAMTALHLALKVYDSPTVRVIKLSCLVKLGNGEFTVDDIIQKEQDLVRALGWRINPPTPDCFLQRYMELLPFLDDDDEERDVDPSEDGTEEDDQLSPIERRRLKRLMKLEELASEFIEVAMARDRFLSVPPSVIAYAALLSAMELATAEQQKQKQSCYYDWATFLRNMTKVAEMDDILSDFGAESLDGNPNGKTVSRSVLRTKMLLDRIVKGLDVPSDEQDDDFSLARTESDSNISDKTSDGDDERGDCERSAKSAPPSPTSTASSVNRAPRAPQL
mmetsp:Transcript_7609/g.18636  ORF Transcript_7609/g.18636 Transcript_7609/m.18636 type:complete len:369 (-) Transcript_7609:162-1268(-)